MCGEHLVDYRARRAEPGSSPHVRGALGGTVTIIARGGIIPACAGSTRNANLSNANLWDHPRMCGEHPLFGRRWRVKQGSSPHVRGAHRTFWTSEHSCGIIPACAGSTSNVLDFRTFLWDHPRMCGEHLSVVKRLFQRLGSSPHVRGALAEPVEYAADGGIIPACAGST